MSPSDSERELVWKAYCELGLIERHHGGIQSSYRTLASTWMLAAFAGIGFVISQDMTVDIAGELLVAAIALACGVGLYLLWVLDLLVTQRLLDAAYIEARRLESSHHWLPQPRNNMRSLLRGKGLAYAVRFYVVGMEVMVCIVGIGIGWFLARESYLVYRAPAGVVFAAVLIFLPMYLKWRTSTTLEQETEMLNERNKRPHTS